MPGHADREPGRLVLVGVIEIGIRIEIGIEIDRC